LQNGNDLVFGESGFAHGDLLQEHNQYAGRSLNVNGPLYRDTYIISSCISGSQSSASAGKICIFNRFGERSRHPISLAKLNNPINRRRAGIEHSTTFSSVQNSGLTVLMRAI
ncbi:hypothetical protein AAHC63_28280, partial [Klebsiella quasipneumoniae subsp. quasipneumoniae]|uniref:hypothetical protein n=1 Tax=Klebsiella quasipneumoniae TaxID=1463165 RepID=UPI003966EBAA